MVTLTFTVVVLLLASVVMTASLFTFNIAVWDLTQKISDAQHHQLIQHDEITRKLMGNILINTKILNKVNVTTSDINQTSTEINQTAQDVNATVNGTS